MLNIIFWSLAISLAINAFMFLVAFQLQSDKLTDASYAASFILLAVFALSQSDQTVYSIVAVLLVCVWAIRLGGFLVYRILRSGTDSRFDKIRDRLWGFGKFWLGQALTVWALMIPITVSLSVDRPWRVASLIGVTIWLVGLTLESIADLQKYQFTHDPGNRGKWIDSGIWRYSRHPNYFGEILVWLGIYIYALPNLSAFYAIIGLISPLLITILLIFVSGIPILEKNADRRWGSKPAYKTYKKRTSILLPLPPKKNV